jgi:hypothetical protein
MTATIADAVTFTVEVGFSTNSVANRNPVYPLTWSQINWTDVSAYVQSVQIDRGKSSELDTFPAGTAQVRFKNDDRIFDPENEPYVTLPGVAANYISTPDSAALSITGDIDIAVRVACDNWTTAYDTFVGKSAGAGLRSYHFYTYTDGKLALDFSLDGTGIISVQASATTGLTAGTAYWVRVTRASVSGNTNFYYAPDSVAYPSTWTQVGTANRASTAGGFFDSTQQVEIGTNNNGSSSGPLAGKVYRAIVKNGIAGTTVADFEPRRFTTLAATTMVASTGETWTLNTSGGTPATRNHAPYYGALTPMRPIRITAARASSSVTSTRIYTGFVNDWPQSWLTPAGSFVTVPCTDALGVMNRTNFRSYWEWKIRQDGPYMWYRLGEGTGATTAIDTMAAIPGLPWVNANSTGSQPSISASSLTYDDSNGASTFDGARGLTYGGGLPVTGSFAAHDVTLEAWFSTTCVTDGTYGIAKWGWGEFAIGFGMKVTAGVGKIIAWQGSIGGVDIMQIYAPSTVVNDGQSHHAVVTLRNSTTHPYLDGVDMGSYTGGTWNGSIGYFANPDTIGLPMTQLSTGQTFASAFIGTIDEVIFWNKTLTSTQIIDHYNIGKGVYGAGDLASTRVATILTVANWPTDARQIATSTTAVQGVAVNGKSALALLQEVDKTEQGMLFADKDGSIRFISKDALSTTALYNTSQATFGDAAGEFAYNDIVPSSGERYVYNSIRASRINGSEYIVENATSILEYWQRTLDFTGLIANGDGYVLDLANARAAEYAEPQMRIESMRFSPRDDPTNLYGPAITYDIGTRLTVNRRPQSVGSAISKQVRIVGISHTIDAGGQSWETTYRLAPVFYTDQFVLDSATYGVLDSSRIGY